MVREGPRKGCPETFHVLWCIGTSQGMQSALHLAPAQMILFVPLLTGGVWLCFFPSNFPSILQNSHFPPSRNSPRVCRVSPLSVCLSRRSVPAGRPPRLARALLGKLLRKLLGKLGDHVCTFPVNNVSIGPVLRKNFRSISQQFAAFRSNSQHFAATSQQAKNSEGNRSRGPVQTPAFLAGFCKNISQRWEKSFPARGVSKVSVAPEPIHRS